MFQKREITKDITLRVLQPGDAPALAAAYERNRNYLAPWEPARSEEFFTEAWQIQDIQHRLAAEQAGDQIPLGLFSEGTLIGRLNLGGITRGPFQSAGIGYWIDSAYTGRGLASSTVKAVIEEARDNLGLHRIEASTLLHNIESQRVLLKNGFQEIGIAPQFLQIAGEWQDHRLYQIILHD